MTDDRSLERAARSWLELGPTEAPDHAVEAALLRIQTTSQERDWHVQVPWRIGPMTLTSRLAAAVVAIAIIAIGGALILRPGGGNVATTPSLPPSGSIPSPSPSPSPSDTLAQLQAYRAAVGAVCSSLVTVPDPSPSAARADLVAFLEATIARQNQEVAALQAIHPPTAIAAEHVANIQTAKDVIALLNHEIDLINANRMAEAATVDEATGSLNTLREQFATKYALPSCP